MTLAQQAEDRARRSWVEGPARTRLESLPPQVGDQAPDLELPEAAGRTRRLSEFWADGPALLIFMRHFGCSCLAERWERLQNEIPIYEAEGATLVAVCQAEPERAVEVARRRGYQMPLLCDPEREAYRAYGLVEGTPAQILHDFRYRPGDAETVDNLLAERRGTEKAMVDNIWQLPGEFVVSPDGELVLTYRYQYCEDFPPRTVLVGAIRAAGAS